MWNNRFELTQSSGIIIASSSDSAYISVLQTTTSSVLLTKLLIFVDPWYSRQQERWLITVTRNCNGGVHTLVPGQSFVLLYHSTKR